MNETRTTEMLQRVPAILAVTASSYGLSWQADAPRKPQGGGERRHGPRPAASEKPVAHK